MNKIVLLVLLLQVKHFIFDILIPSKYHWRKYIDVAGMVHSLLNGVFTALVFYLILPIPTLWVLSIFIADSFIHYHIDFVKDYYSTYTTNQELISGVDQLLHQITYLLLILLVL